MPMAGFELGYSGIGSDRFATNTGPRVVVFAFGDQRDCLLLRRSEFESYCSLQFFLYAKMLFEKNKNTPHKKRLGFPIS